MQHCKITLSGTDYNKKLQREQVQGFIDVCALYGMFYRSASGVGYGPILNNTTSLSSSILTSLLNKFVTKATAYLYVFSERGRSYNFYDNYTFDRSSGSSLKIGLQSSSQSSLTATAFGTTNGWPIIIDDSARSNNYNNSNFIFLQFPVTDVKGVFLYRQQLDVGVVTTSGILTGNELLEFSPTSRAALPFTNVVSVDFPAHALANVPSLAIIHYFGKNIEYDLDPSRPGSKYLDEVSSYADDVLDLINAVPTESTEGSRDYLSITSLKFKPLRYARDGKVYGVSIVQSSVIRDIVATATTPVERVVYIIDVIDTKKAKESLASLSLDYSLTTDSSAATFNSGRYQLPLPYLVRFKLFSNGTNIIQGLILATSDNSEPSKLLVGLVDTENSLLQALIIEKNIRNARLVFQDQHGPGTKLISNTTEYFSFNLGVAGELEDSRVYIFFPLTNLVVYSLDYRFYFSQAYSETFDRVGERSLYLTPNPTIY